MNLPYRAYLYLVLAVSAFVAITGAAELVSYAIDEAWPGRVLFGRATSDLASGLARVIVAVPIWIIHWRLAQRQVAKDEREAVRFLRQAYVHLVPAVSLVFVAFNIRSIIIDVLEGEARGLSSDALAAVLIWGGAWTFHWRVARQTWRPGHAGRSLHRWYIYLASAGTLALLGFGISSIAAELLRYAYESAFMTNTITVSGPWTREMRDGLANAAVGGTGWLWFWFNAARGDGGSKLREVYATGASVIGAGSATGTVILAVALLIRPVLGESTSSLAVRWESMPRLVADILVAGAIWLHLSAASPWSRRGASPRDALPGAIAVDIRAWEVFGLAAIAASAVIALALVLSLPVAGREALLVSTSSRLDAAAAIIASGVVGLGLWLMAVRKARRHETVGDPAADTVTRFFHFGIAAAGLLAAVGGAAVALFIVLNDLLKGEIGAATLLDARWGIAIAVVGAAFTAWRWRSIQSLQLRGARDRAEAVHARPRVRVVHSDALEVEVSSGAMTRLAGVSKATVGAEGIHLAIATIPPGHQSSPHYHTNCESAIYVASGRGTFLSGENLEEALPIGRGDFIYVPADAPHQPVNGSETEPLVLIVARNAPVELVVELQGASPKPE